MRKDRGNGGHDASGLDLIVQRMQAYGPLTAPERDLIRSCGGPRDHAPNAVLVEEGQRLTPLWFVSGWACRARMLADGRRQIVNFILPGDGIGFHAHPTCRSPCTVMALTAVRTYDGSIVKTALNDPAAAGLGDVLHRQRSDDEAILCDQVVRLGRQSAFERVSDLLSELNARLCNVGLANGNRFELPLTQEILADAVGLSIVHVNRTLQQMRRQGVVELRSGYVTVLEPAPMRAVEDASVMRL